MCFAVFKYLFVEMVMSPVYVMMNLVIVLGILVCMNLSISVCVDSVKCFAHF